MNSGELYTLGDYNAAKQQVASMVLAVKLLLTKQNADPERCQALLAKLAEDRFNLAVVGQFKRGKSSLMNAVIGRDLLPTGMLPLTSVVTTLCYGPRERVVLRRKGWILEQVIPLRDLAANVTEKGNPGNARGILEARVEMPVKLLRQGLYFSDTPGVGSAQRENTETTYAFLPEADAVILVTSVDAPLSETEIAFLHDIRQWVFKIFVVVNKVDLLASDERPQVLDFIQSGLQQTLNEPEVRLFPLSARQGLEAKLRGDEDGLRLSGLKAFEAALTTFLANEKSKTFLVAVLERALKLLTADVANPTKPSEDAAINAADESQGAVVSAAELAQRIADLREAILRGWPADQLQPEPPVIAADADILKQEVAASRTDKRKKKEASDTAGCPLCTAESQAIFDFFAHWQYVLNTTPHAREAFAQANGFCHVHTWQFQQIASPFGIAEGYLPLVKSARASMREIADLAPAEGAVRIRELMPESEHCPACQVLREAANAKLDELLVSLGGTEGREAYQRERGVCLPHLQMLLTKEPTQEVLDTLLNQQAQYLEDLSDDMQAFVLKREARRRGLINENEETAWWRALAQLVGERSAQYDWRG